MALEKIITSNSDLKKNTTASIDPNAEGNWDIVIGPTNPLFNFQFKEIWSYRDLLRMFIRRDFAAQYKQTILGPLWHLIQPLLTTLFFYVVFSRIAKISTDGLPPVLFYLSGITCWNFFSSIFTGCSNIFVQNAWLFSKVYFPRLIMPIGNAIGALLRFGIQLLLLLPFFMYYSFNGYDFSIGWGILLLPVAILMMSLIGLSMGIIISSLTVKYRDMTIIVGFATQLLMFATPIVYPSSMIDSESLRFWIMLNPLTSVVELFRYASLGVGTVSIAGTMYSFAFMVIALIVGLILFNRTQLTAQDKV